MPLSAGHATPRSSWHKRWTRRMASRWTRTRIFSPHWLCLCRTVSENHHPRERREPHRASMVVERARAATWGVLRVCPAASCSASLTWGSRCAGSQIEPYAFAEHALPNGSAAVGDALLISVGLIFGRTSTMVDSVQCIRELHFGSTHIPPGQG